ncbi:hypothetical protein JL722_3201 [Aureococcus anophagefferens]|nr:hypothetical protein JL722_3201 [Aureococcus anophagefferens]
MRSLIFALSVAATTAELVPKASALALPNPLRRFGGGLGKRGGEKQQPASELLTPGETLVAGAAARMVAQTILHPLDVVRTRTQAVSMGTSSLAESLSFGLIPQVGLSAPAGAIQFTAVRKARKALENALPDDFEVMKQGCMVELYPNALVAFSTILAEKGLAGFYKGAVATITRDVMWNSLSFSIFRLLLDYANTSNPKAQYSLGIAEGWLAALATHPFDVAKTRVMTSSGDLTVGLFAQLAGLVEAEGWQVLLSGLVPRLLYLGPLASLVLATNEVIAGALVKARGGAQRAGGA